MYDNIFDKTKKISVKHFLFLLLLLHVYYLSNFELLMCFELEIYYIKIESREQINSR